MEQIYNFTAGRENIPVGTMFCVGKNYSAHAKEMGGEVSKEPVIFLKPPQAYVANNSDVILPDISGNVHHEAELVVVIGKDCINIEQSEAGDYIAGYGVGIDLTLRDIQQKAKDEGKPWTTAKAFYQSAPISDIIPAGELNNRDNFFNLELNVNGELRQKVNTSEMERPVEFLVAYLSRVFTLRRGDCIFTGTPKGVGPVKKGDNISVSLDNLVSLEINIK